MAHVCKKIGTHQISTLFIGIVILRFWLLSPLTVYTITQKPCIRRSMSFEGQQQEAEKEKEEPPVDTASNKIAGSVVGHPSNYTTPDRKLREHREDSMKCVSQEAAQQEMIGILFMQRMMDSPEPPNVFTDFWTLAYGAME